MGCGISKIELMMSQELKMNPELDLVKSRGLKEKERHDGSLDIRILHL